jgi:NAD-dependent dihydropyrimidine dehydrogenase PreA subunit
MLAYLKNVVTLALDREKCIGCALCADVCPHGVFAVSDGKVRIAKRDSCMECGACALNCPASALSVKTGVGCASAVISSLISRKEVSCDCSDGGCC